MPGIFFGKRPPEEGEQQSTAPAALPGVQTNEQMQPEMAAMLLNRTETQKTIGEQDIKRATEILAEYKRGKANLETRIVDDELWWELRHWEAIKGRATGRVLRTDAAGRPLPEPPKQPEPTSAWLFNSILNKHADAMDNFPEPVVLPRERSDEESAKTLSSVLPVILEQNQFEQVYSDNWWEKLKHGTAAYGVFWDTSKENGLGDITVQQIDLLKLFWEPGVTDIQKSRNLFVIDLVDTDLLEQQYPQCKGMASGAAIDVKQYIYDDTVDTSNKSVVVDWYYKVRSPAGKTLLHYVKFVGNTLLYASENDPAYRERGFYDHGKYPIVLDVMFPEKGTPVGFGYVAICKDPQLYIDRLSGNILENAMMTTKKRFFCSTSTNVNKDQFLDWNEPIVDVEGELNDARIKEIATQPLDSIYVNVLQMKIEEMKDTAANRDVNSGGTGSGVTAAAAIAALQEAGNKASRDMLTASYRAHVQISSLCVELIRQFYDVSRSFRITNSAKDGYTFADVSNAKLKEQPTTMGANGEMLYRVPVFDLKIHAQKKNPFSRAEQNQRAQDLYQMGFFNPDRAQESLGALDMMEFEGIDKVREYVQQGQTLLTMCQQLAQENTVLKAAMGIAQPQTAGTAASGQQMTGSSINTRMADAQQQMTDYGQRLAERSRPDMEGKT